jgi:hypothetical protein
LLPATNSHLQSLHPPLPKPHPLNIMSKFGIPTCTSWSFHAFIFIPSFLMVCEHAATQFSSCFPQILSNTVNHVVPLSSLALPCLHCWSLHHLGATFKSSYILSIWWKGIQNTIDDLTNNFANNNRLFWESDLEPLDRSEGS